MPAGFPVASPSRDLSRWWNRFDDPTLTRIISDALKNSPDMASASARVRESQARRNAEAASNLPFVQGTTSAASRTNSQDGFGTDSSSNYAAGLNASWEADLFGKRKRSAVRPPPRRSGPAEENFNSVQAALASEIAITYTQLRVNEARARSALPHHQHPRGNHPARHLAHPGRRGGFAGIQPGASAAWSRRAPPSPRF